MLTIEKALLPVGSMKRPGTKLGTLLGVTIHNTGNYDKGANAEAHKKYCHNTANQMYDSYHYVVDDQKAVQLIPEDEVSWHAGDGANGTGNNRTISIEICVNHDGDLTKATENAAELAAQILNRHGVDTLYQHWHWTGKDCPHELRTGKPYSWNKFVERVTYYQGHKEEAAKPATDQLYRVRKSWADAKSQIGAFKSLENAKKSCGKGYSVFDNGGECLYTNKAGYWDYDATLVKGDKVSSRACKIAVLGNTNSAIKSVGGTECVNVPDLGGLVPLAHISESTLTKDGKRDNYLANTNALVYLDTTTVQAVDVKTNRVMVHGYWVNAGPLCKWVE